MLSEASITKPMSADLLATWLPSMITRTWALLPSMAAVELGTDEISGWASRSGFPAAGRLDSDGHWRIHRRQDCWSRLRSDRLPVDRPWNVMISRHPLF